VRAAALLVLILGAIALSGCLHAAWETSREGTPRAVIEARRLTPGTSTMKEALDRLGPPDLAIRSGESDRFYYVSWDTSHFKFDLSAPVPLPSRSVSWDVFILSLGSEELRLARLDFDRAGVLKVLQVGDFEATNNGQYFVLDNRIVANFLEDRARSLGIVENDDDEEDVELDRPKK
jgi:hypothetical protein